jgi:hypothetical protein
MHTETNHHTANGFASNGFHQGGRRQSRKTARTSKRASVQRTNSWFRLYAETLDDIKVQSLPGELFKAWINLLCLANLHRGRLPGVEEIAFRLRISVTEAGRIVDALLERGLLDRTGEGFTPHNWARRQFLSDCSTGRVRRHREERSKQRHAGDCDDDETLHETFQETHETHDETPPPRFTKPFPSESASGSECVSSIQGRKGDLEGEGYARGNGNSYHSAKHGEGAL